MTVETVVVAKPWWRSKTLWINVLAAIVAIAAELQNAVPLPEQVSTYVVAGMAAVNVVLRLLTQQPVTASLTPQAKLIETPRPAPPGMP